MIGLFVNGHSVKWNKTDIMLNLITVDKSTKQDGYWTDNFDFDRSNHGKQC